VSVQFETFGKYVLLEKLATGGMAEVFLARGNGAGGIGKFFAVKRILPQYADSPEFIDMFKDEAKIAINLAHSNIVSIHEFGVEKGQFFLVMDYVEGRNLRQILNKMKKSSLQFSIDQIVYIIKEVASGLDHAHRCLDGGTGKPLNITHRDMSPQNVMVSFEGEVKIVDFGIAKAESQIETTRAGTLKGKFGYMSPEQAEGQPVDLRTDIFSLGIVLWELLANDRLFVANNEINTLRKIRDCQIPSLRKINPNIHAELERIVLKSLARDRNLRYQTGAALHRDLNRFLNRQFPDFSPQDFSVFIKSVFADEILSLRKRLVDYTKLNPSTQAATSTGRREEEDSSSSLSGSMSSSLVRAITDSHGEDIDESTMITATDISGPQDLRGDPEMDPTQLSEPGLSKATIPEISNPAAEFSLNSQGDKTAATSSDAATKLVNTKGTTTAPPDSHPNLHGEDTPALQVGPKPTVATPKKITSSMLLDEHALAQESKRSEKEARLARELAAENTSITRAKRHKGKKDITIFKQKRKSGSAFVTLFIFLGLAFGAYAYLAKYFTNTMEPVIAKADPYVGPIHDALGIPRRGTSASSTAPTPTSPTAPPPAQAPVVPPPATEEPAPVAEVTPAPTAPSTPLAEVAIAVTSNPSGAEIFFNDQPTGLSTPNQVKVQSQRPFSITVRKRGYRDVKRSGLSAETLTQHRVDINLDKMRVGYLDIEIFPPQDAVLYVNGKLTPVHRSLARDVAIPAGTPVKVRAESAGQNTYQEETVVVSQDRHKTVRLNPRKMQRQPSGAK
jgi:serine/threonine protein kinase